jgi:hypothetical protein
MVSCAVMMASLAPSVARADDSAAPDDAARQRVADQIRDDAKVEEASRNWFGGTIIVLDAVTGVTTDAIWANSSSGSGTLLGFGLTSLAGYTFGAPIVHWAHGQLGLGFASLGLHLAGGLGGLTTAGLLSVDGPSAAGMVLGGLIFAIPTVIDTALLSTTHTKHEWTTKSAWAPTFQVRRGGATAGFAAEF